MKKESAEYSEEIVRRFRRIMELTDLDIPGIADFLGKSPSHIYGILNGSRLLSSSFAKELGDKLGFDGMRIFNLNSSIPIHISKSTLLAQFKIENQDNKEYFLSSKSQRSLNSFIKDVLLKSDFFDSEPRYLKEITAYCREELNREFLKDELSKGLRYAVSNGLLKSRKQFILLNSGSFGKRLVDVYYR